jgi:hypothetical protein
MLQACDRETSVQAGREDDGYQPLPAPSQDNTNDTFGTTPNTGNLGSTNNQQIQGELIRVDASGKNIVVRAENGMEQTFKIDDQTTVTGMPLGANRETTPGREGASRQGTPMAANSLMGKEGSMVTVNWMQQGSDKTAVSIDVKR